MKKLVNYLGVFLVNIATTSALTGRSRFIFYEPKVPHKLKEKQNIGNSRE